MRKFTIVNFIELPAASRSSSCGGPRRVRPRRATFKKQRIEPARWPVDFGDHHRTGDRQAILRFWTVAGAKFQSSAEQCFCFTSNAADEFAGAVDRADHACRLAKPNTRVVRITLGK